MFEIQNNRGSVTVIAVFTVLILGIFVAGIIPRATTELKLSTKNRDNTEAVFAAEAGVKNVLVGFLNYNSDWSWLKNDQQFAGSVNKKYNVTVKDASNQDIAQASSPAVGTYTITSIGTVNGATRTIIVSVNMPIGYNGRSSTSSTGSWNIPIDAGMYASTISIKNNANIGIGGAKVYVGSGGFSEGNNSTPVTAITETITLPQFDINKIKAAAGTQTSLPTVANSNLSGTYYINGPLTLDQHTPNMTANNAIIFVNGDLNITDNSFNLNGTVAIIANNIYIKNNAGLDQPLLIALNDITIANNISISGGAFIAGGTININDNASLNLKTNSNASLFNLLNNDATSVASPALSNWKEWYSI
jgi:Tfp pilus assembly protein PilX